MGTIIKEHNLLYLRDTKPQIAIIAPPLDSVPSPSGNAIYTLIEEYVIHSKFPIIIFSISNYHNTKSKIENQIIYYNKPFSNSLIHSILGYKLSKKILKTNNLAFLEYYKFAYSICKKYSIEVVLQEEFADILPYINKKPFKIILHQHGLIDRRLWKRLINSLKHVVFVSQKSLSYDNKEHLGLINSSVIYNGVNLNNFEISNTIEDPIETVFLYVGRIHPSKGLLPLIEAFRHININNVKLNIIGDIEYKYGVSSDFINNIKQLSVGNINLIGKKNQIEIANFLNQSDFIIVPSIGGEGLPKVITEAVIMGVPVICSDRGGNLELIEDKINGIIIMDPINEVNIKNAIETAIKNKKNLKANSMKKVDSYRNKLSIQNMAYNFDKLFDQILRSQK